MPKRGKNKDKNKKKPKRPLTAYNFYFQEEHERIKKEFEDEEKEKEKAAIEEAKREGRDTPPPKPRKKISPREVMGFNELGKAIGRRWKEVKSEDREKYKKMAEEDAVRYKKEIVEYYATISQVVTTAYEEKRRRRIEPSDGQVSSATDPSANQPSYYRNLGDFAAAGSGISALSGISDAQTQQAPFPVRGGTPAGAVRVGDTGDNERATESSAAPDASTYYGGMDQYMYNPPPFMYPGPPQGYDPMVYFNEAMMAQQQAWFQQQQQQQHQPQPQQPPQGNGEIMPMLFYPGFSQQQHQQVGPQEAEGTGNSTAFDNPAATGILVTAAEDKGCQH